MKTLTAGALAEKVKNNVKLVWLLEIDADTPDASPVTLYYGSRKYTLSSKTYLDFFTPTGLRLSWDRIRLGGGLASVATVQAAIRNETVESNVTDTYFLENDEMRVYASFATGSEVKADAVQLARSFIEDTPFSLRAWVLEGIDGTDKDFKAIPQDIVNLVDHPDAPYDQYAKPLPFVAGALNVGPHDDAGAFAFLAPCRCTNGFLREFTAGKRLDVYGAGYQYYPTARRYGEVVNSTQSDETLTVTDARRKMRLYPVLPAGTNDVTNYPKVFDGDTATSVTVGAAANLDVIIGGVPKLGTIVSAQVVIKAGGGSFGYDILLNAVSKASAGAVTGDQSISLTAAPTDHADNWNFELYEVQIDGSAGSPTLEQIYLEITYDDQLTSDRQALNIHQKVTGWEDLAANYQDGAVIDNSGDPLDNPAHVLGALLRGKAMLEMLTADVDATALATAATARTGWSFRFAVDQTVDEIEWLNRFCFEGGMHLFKSFEGKWKMVAMDKTKTPQHCFLEDEHIAVTNPEAARSEWEPDINFGKTPTRDIINEVVLKYRKDRGTGEYSALEISSGRHRVTGTCSTSETTEKLIDAAATFVTDKVAVGDTVYVVGDKDYTVDAIDSETQLDISTLVGGVNDNAAGTTYYVGPNLVGEMKRSQLRYKTTNPLGEETKNFRELGGFGSDFIGDSATAAKVITHLQDWSSERRMTIEFATFWNAIDVELGDVCFFDHSWLPTTKRPVQLGTLTNAETVGSTAFESANATLFRVNDFVLVGDKEVVKVTSVDYVTEVDLVVTRGQCNTTAVAHLAGVSLKRLNFVKWEVTGIRIDIEAAQIRLELQEMPPHYKPQGRVVTTGYPVYDTATAAQRAQAGWATLLSGRVEDNDIYSAISYVGPDTGTY